MQFCTWCSERGGDGGRAGGRGRCAKFRDVCSECIYLVLLSAGSAGTDGRHARTPSAVMAVALHILPCGLALHSVCNCSSSHSVEENRKQCPFSFYSAYPIFATYFISLHFLRSYKRTLGSYFSKFLCVTLLGK